MIKDLSVRPLFAWFLAAVFAGLAGAAFAADLPTTTHDGLELVSGKATPVVYRSPTAGFSQYKRIAILECPVAFRKNWQRDQNTGGQRVSSRDMERIKTGLSEMFRSVFVEELQGAGGYPLVEEAGEDVLVLRPAIVNLDVAAPDTMSAGRSRSFSTSAGSMTLVLELYDSMSGEILARVIDQERARDTGFITWQNQVSNRAEAERMLRKWAKLAHEGMDRARAAPGSAN